MKNNFNKAFTLVELIVVITILAVLATVAFISFQGYTSSSRDSVRLADLKNISKSFEINRTKGINFPLPDKKVDISSSGTIFQYQGELSQEILNSHLNIFDGGVDPLTGDNYGYAVNSARNKFQIIGFLENQESVANISMNKIFADNSDKYVKSSGDTLGILLDETTNEIIVDKNNILEIDVDTNTGSYVLSLENKLVGIDSGLLASKMNFRVNNNASCYAILQSGLSTGDGVYTINPTGEREFDVNCDMKSGGWTHFESTFNYRYSGSQQCINEKLFSDTQKNNIVDLLSVANDVEVQSDMYTSIQADDSTNNSIIYANVLDSGEVYNIEVGYGRNNTVLRLDATQQKIKCSATDESNRCGYLNKPIRDEYTPNLVFFEFDYQPQCNGSTATNDGWHRNQFNLRGTYYNISIK